MAEKKTYFSKEELARLYTQAEDFNSDVDIYGMNDCQYIYKNKNTGWWEETEFEHDGYIPLGLKDQGGDPRCPINGRMKGIYFAANVDQFGDPMPKSKFGDKRWLLDIDSISELLQEAPNLYFADFFCMQGKPTHYVTLVLTKPGSKADKIANKKLLELDLQDNPFFCSDGPGSHQVTGQTWVEIFYTEQLELNKGEFDGEVYETCSLKLKGLPKTPTCQKCNL